MMSPAGAKLQRNTATVSPLDHVTSPTNGVTSVGASAALNASRTSSFAAALRKLANQAKDAPGIKKNFSIIQQLKSKYHKNKKPKMVILKMEQFDFAMQSCIQNVQMDQHIV